MATINDLNSAARLPTLGSESLNQPHKIHALNNFSKYCVLSIEPFCLFCCDEELGAVGVGPSISHGEEARLGVLELEVLIRELSTINTLTTSSIEVGKVTTPVVVKVSKGKMRGRSGLSLTEA